MSKHCRARTKAGKPCKAVAVDGGLCAFHADPKRAAQLGRMGGSKNRRHDPLRSETEPLRPPQTAKEVKDLLAEAMAGIHAGRLEPRMGSVIGKRISTALHGSHCIDRSCCAVTQLCSDSPCDVVLVSNTIG